MFGPNAQSENFGQEQENWIIRVERAWESEELGEEIQRRLGRDCDECGDGIGEEELHQTLLGLDVVGLFPAIQSASAGRIVSRRIKKSGIQMNGFNLRHRTRHILVNKYLTGEIKSLWKILPWTKSGKEIGITNKELNSKTAKIEAKWCFPPTEQNEEQQI